MPNGKKFNINEKCPPRTSLKLLGDKWTLIILYQINENVLRCGELKRVVTGIGEKC